MKSNHFFKAAIAAALLIIAFVISLNYYWKSQGFLLSYNDDKIFWTQMRKEIYVPADKATVFIGSSRIKFDIDIETWEKLTGEKALQLAIVGTSPRSILLNLANDEQFAGKLVIDEMEPLFFNTDTTRTELSARDAIKYYYDETPAQRISTSINYALESKLLFLEEGKFGINNLLKENSQKNNRPGVVVQMLPFKKKDVIVSSRRQNSLTPHFVNDPEIARAHIARWEKVSSTRKLVPYAVGKSLDSFCVAMKTAVDKIRSRGGSVVFVRLPSNGGALAREKKFFPREKYWQHLLETTQTRGYHYADYPETAGMICPELSHLTPADAKKYTAHLVSVLRKEEGWKFPADNAITKQ